MRVETLSFSLVEPDGLPSSRKGAILEQCYGLVRQVFKGVDRQETADHIFGTNPTKPQSLLLVYEGEAVVAFSGFQVITIGNHQVVYRVGTVLHPDHQSKGLYKRMIRECFPEGSTALVLRSQNPRVYQGILSSGLFSRIYPDTNGDIVPQDVVNLVQGVIDYRMMDIILGDGSLLVKDSYSGGLYQDRILSRNDAVNRLFAPLYPSDGYLIVGFV